MGLLLESELNFLTHGPTENVPGPGRKRWFSFYLAPLGYPLWEPWEARTLAQGWDAARTKQALRLVTRAEAVARAVFSSRVPVGKPCLTGDPSLGHQQTSALWKFAHRRPTSGAQSTPCAMTDNSKTCVAFFKWINLKAGRDTVCSQSIC